MRKPLIGIVANVTKRKGTYLKNYPITYAGEDYAHAIECSGGVPIVIPIIEEKLIMAEIVSLCDGVVFTGGQDINPLFYDNEPEKNIGKTNVKVDIFQLEIMEIALKLKKPILAICRGHQVLNVALGGTLHQDIHSDFPNALRHMQTEDERYTPIHTIDIVEDSILRKICGSKKSVNSFHHQSISTLGKDLRVVAQTKDGIIEAVEGTGSQFVLGLQWHPEMMFEYDDDVQNIFSMFIKRCLYNE